MTQCPCVGPWRRRKAPGGIAPIAQGNPLCGIIATRLGANPKIRRYRRCVLAAIAAIPPSTRSGPHSCGRPRTRPFYPRTSARCRAISASRAHARAPASHDRQRPSGRVWRAIWGPARAYNRVRADTDRTGLVPKSARIRRGRPIRLAPGSSSRRLELVLPWPHPARVAPAPRSLRPIPRSVPFAHDCPGKFVKNQYEFPSDFRFVSGRCRKDTVRVKDCCN